MYVSGFRRLFAFEGYVIERVNLNTDMVQVNLRRDRRFRLSCPQCGTRMARNRSRKQVAYDLPLGTAGWVTLVYEAVQGRCPCCEQCHTVRPSCICKNARATWRMMRYVSALCRFMAPSRVSEFVPVSTSTARRWDKRVLETELPEPDLDDLEVLLVDEKSVGKHHQYMTVVWDGRSGELLYMAEGKKKRSLRGFFDKLEDRQKESIRAVGMDRGGAYKQVVEEEVPEARIVYDKFHLIKNYHQVIDEVRRQEWRRADEEHKDLVKGQRYNLFRNEENLTDQQEQTLQRLLDENERLNTVYVLKDALRKLWEYTYRGCAETYLHRWAQWARESGLEPLKKFARGLLEAKEQVLNYCDHRITLGPLEGFNNLISRTLHRACGYQDMDYFFLKLRQASLKPRPQE